MSPVPHAGGGGPRRVVKALGLVGGGGACESPLQTLELAHKVQAGRLSSLNTRGSRRLSPLKRAVGRWSWGKILNELQSNKLPTRYKM